MISLHICHVFRRRCPKPIFRTLLSSTEALQSLFATLGMLIKVSFHSNSAAHRFPMAASCLPEASCINSEAPPTILTLSERRIVIENYVEEASVSITSFHSLPIIYLQPCKKWKSKSSSGYSHVTTSLSTNHVYANKHSSSSCEKDDSSHILRQCMCGKSYERWSMEATG